MLTDLMTSASRDCLAWMTACISFARSVEYLLFTVNFFGHFSLIPATIFHIRGSVGLLLKRSFILYRSWKLWVFQGEIVRRQKLIPVRVFVRAGNPGSTAGRGFNPAGGAPGGG
ncbi:hypothetical protein F511_13518 [Dorcoceras hygrometricum]|uniref:Uncharacterized protein n=1 Tax=Dorcoceras hygrometricum TaxID=472368 RepID=A0A2Z7BHG7_9LAMI|nr:hypothetical protein F511_13518 [Dorcoceras hygrometricum]